MNENDTVRCGSCGEEFVTDRGRRCPECFPEDSHISTYPVSEVGIEVGDKVEYRSVDGLLQTVRVERVDRGSDGEVAEVAGQGRVLAAYRVLRVVERTER